MKILFVGDIFGKVGRKCISKYLSFIKKSNGIDFIIANGENISNGRGINKNHYNFLLENGVNVITLGNHYKDNFDFFELANRDNVVRPLNLKNNSTGQGSIIYMFNGIKIRITNLLGTAFMKEEVNSPYYEIMKIIEHDDSDIHIVDFHAEATGEKKALAYALKDYVKVFIGTHTHIQTADNQIMDNKMAFISDVGMCGGFNSVLGDQIDSVVNKVIKGDESSRFKALEDDDMLFNGVIIEFDKLNNPIKIERINIKNGEQYN